MKKALQALWRAVCHGSVVFTAIILFFALFVFNTETAHFDKETILSFFKFSLVFGLASFLFVLSRVPSAILYIIHFIISTVGFVAFILAATDRSPSQIFVGIFIFAAVYWIVFAITRLLALPFRKKSASDGE